MKKTIKQFAIFLTSLVVGLTFINQVQAVDYNEFLEELGDSEGEQVDLPNYGDSGDAHGQAFQEEGLTEITSAIYYALDFAKYILGGIAILFMVISAYQLLMAGKGSDEEISKQKNYFVWAIIGLVFVFAADTLVKDMFFGEQGEIFLEDEATTYSFAEKANKGIKGMYTLLEVFIGVVAVLAIAYDGMRMIISSHDEEEVRGAKNHIFWSLIGLVMIGLSELIVKDIIFPFTPEEGVQLGVTEGKMLFANITNFIAGIIGFISVSMIIYAGYLYVTAGVNEQNTENAKKIIFGAVIGIILTGAAFAVTSTILSIE
ncbi:MAG: hypothetical protein UV80_C0002G0184 [Candidatus Peregrinibacteria bacterium GW2011_GWF2_43_17]|nr:MAG: hypothetical protein UV80_C0002G0184 [Candidatus Peregrinibacteria bacterium GW2011_GWF2_43_17]HAU39772.1 hypothetical protein [Candidatus Peregrinibacteria bacterium]